jgi:hypothetical protein
LSPVPGLIIVSGKNKPMIYPSAAGFSLRYVFGIVILLCFITENSFSGSCNKHINTGTWTPVTIDALLAESSRIQEPGKRVDFLSRQFLGVPYKASTLIGDIRTAEAFVLDLSGVDCFTFLDYIEAMRRSGSYDAFKKNLQNVRYHSGDIAVTSRNHFFTDWIGNNSAFIADVTAQIGGTQIKSIVKLLNGEKASGQLLAGIPVRERKINYISSAALTDPLLEKLQTGDYIGFYAEENNLDVSHVGIIIKDRSTILLRHASSEKEKVIDDDFKHYAARKPGIVILRPQHSPPR